MTTKIVNQKRDLFMSKIAVPLLLLISSALIISGVSSASAIDDIRILKISGQDQRAVIMDPVGKTRVIKPGDPIGKSGKVAEIADNRVVIEEKKGSAIEKIIIKFTDGIQTIERLSRTKEQAPLLFAPATQNHADTRVH